MRGIVACPPVIVGENSLHFRDGANHAAIRQYILFWDKVLAPKNRILNTPFVEEERFLIDEGVLERPYCNSDDQNNDSASVFVLSHLGCFLANEMKEPGNWALADTFDGVSFSQGNAVIRNRGIGLELMNCIPLPAGDVPYQDLLEFKGKRKDELSNLHHEIDGLFLEIIKSPDSAVDFNHAREKVDRACADMMKVAKESSIKFHLSGVKFSFNYNIKDILKGTFLGRILGYNFDMVEIGAVGATLKELIPNLNISADIGFSASFQVDKSHPYRFVSEMHKELS